MPRPGVDDHLVVAWRRRVERPPALGVGVTLGDFLFRAVEDAHERFLRGRVILEVRLDKPDGPLLGQLKVGEAADWNISRGTAKKIPAGVHDLFVSQPGAGSVEVDWISFR